MVEAVADGIEEEREDLLESKDPFLSTTFFTVKGRDGTLQLLLDCLKIGKCEFRKN